MIARKFGYIHVAKTGAVMQHEPVIRETDVLIVGGGVAGCLAALTAREAGVRVLVADKARLLERAGSVGGGVDQYLTAMNSGPEWDTPEFLLMHVPKLTDGLADMAVAERVVHEMPRVLRKLEAVGVNFKDPNTGEYFRTRAFGLPGTFHLNFDGKRFKYYIARAARRAGADVLGRTSITQVLVDGATNRAYGAIGFNVRSGEWYAIRARAIILATGDVNRISRNASGVPFDSWHYPYNTGDGHAIGFRVGADLVNMEFVEATLTPKGFSTQGTNAYAGLGAYFLNRHGERFMFRYDPNGEKARRTKLIEGVINEVLAGNEPLYIDLRHLPDETLDHFVRTLGIDRHTLPGFFEQKKLDIRRQPIEISVSELSIRRSGVYFRGSGLVVDVHGETRIEGLFAAGDCSTVSGGIAGAAAMGTIAGRGAAARAQAGAALPELDPRTLDEARERLAAPLERGAEGGVGWWDFEERIRRTVTDYIGFSRTEPGLREGLKILLELKREEPLLHAADLHGLMRVHESKNIRRVVELMARAALERTESRSGAAHRRLDYPQTDDERWRKFIVLRRGGDDGVSIRHQPPDVPLAVGAKSLPGSGRDEEGAFA